MFFAMLAALMLIAAPVIASEEPIRVSTFDELEKEAGNYTTRTIVLTDNIKETTKSLVINGTLTLDLNGHTLNITPAHNTSAIHVMSGNHLIIKNAGIITTAKEILLVYEGAALTISNGTFLGPIDIEDKSQTNITGVQREPTGISERRLRSENRRSRRPIPRPEKNGGRTLDKV